MQLEARQSAWAQGASRNEHGQPVPDALRECVDRLRASLADEAERLHLLVLTHLPNETGTIDVVRDEHATLNGLVGLLNERLAACERGEDGADAAVGVVLHDLVEVWCTHVRRLDGVIEPLLHRLEGHR